MNLAATAAALLGALALVALGERRRRGASAPWSSWAAVLAFQALVLGLHRVTNPWGLSDLPGRDHGRAGLRPVASGCRARAEHRWPDGGRRGRPGGDHPPLVLAVPPALRISRRRDAHAPDHAGLPVAAHLRIADGHRAHAGRRDGSAIRGARLRARDARTAAIGVVALLSAVALAAALFWGAEPWSARILLAGLMGTVGLAAWHARDRPHVLVPLACFAAAALLTAVPEVVAVRDTLAGSIPSSSRTCKRGCSPASGRRSPCRRSRASFGRDDGVGPSRCVPDGSRCFPASSPWPLIYPVAATPHKLGLRIQQLPATLDGEAFLNGGEIRDEGAAHQPDVRPARTDVAARERGGRADGRRSPDDDLSLGRARVGVHRPAGGGGWDWHTRQQHWGYVHAVDARLTTCRSSSPPTIPSARGRYWTDITWI